MYLLAKNLALLLGLNSQFVGIFHFRALFSNLNKGVKVLHLHRKLGPLSVFLLGLTSTAFRRIPWMVLDLIPYIEGVIGRSTHTLRMHSLPLFAHYSNAGLFIVSC